jgi:hypothetical protein
METLSIRKRKNVNQWNKNYISPGVVGSVGDAVQNIRLKQSAPDLAPRWEYKRAQLEQKGSGIGDGSVPNNYTGASSSNTFMTDYYNSPYEEYVVGESIQDLRPNDLAATTRELGAPQFGWKSTQAVTAKARVMGDKFLPLPNGYPRSGVSRGPEPRSTFLVDVGNPNASFTAPQVSSVQPQLNPNNPMLPPGGGQPCLNNTTGPTPAPTGTTQNDVTATTAGGFFDQISNVLQSGLGITGAPPTPSTFGLGRIGL